MSQAELARKIGVDRSRINWIVKYKIDNFTIDKLCGFWSTIDPEFELKVS
jgi:predicted XRE-type DNA-binding protein